MTTVAYANVNGAEIAPRVVLANRRRRLASVVRRYARRDVPFVVSVHKPWQPIVPCDDTATMRRPPKEHADRAWDAIVLEPDDIVLVTYMPEGGGGARSGIKIAMTVATVALLVANPGMAWTASLTNSIGATALTTIRTVAALTVAAGAVAMALTRQSSPAKLYGVSGGGNLARANDRIPVGYGDFWTAPDLAQPDWFTYDGDNQILYKRMVIGLGEYEILEIRVGNTTLWRPWGGNSPPPWTPGGGQGRPQGQTTSAGVTAPFVGTQVEFLYGQASNLVPGDVITSPSVGGLTLPLRGDPNPWAGPYVITPPGTEITRIQVDYQYPQGYWKTNTGTSSPMGIQFEYAPVNDDGDPIGPWQTIYEEFGDRKIQSPKRFTKMKDVPLGRYAVRARNDVQRYTPEAEANHSRDVLWDALRGHTPDVRVRPGVTEVCMRITSGKNLTQTAFSDVQVRARRVGEVWDGSQFVRGQIRKCLDVYVDMLRSAQYGGAEPAALIDLAKVHAYKLAVTEFDTYDGVIRGPVSLWEACSTVLANMRAEPIRLGQGYSFVRDEPSAIRRHIFTRRQMAKSSLTLEYSPQADDGTAHFVVAYNRETDPKRPGTATAYYGQQSRTPKRVEMAGVSSYAHAMHLARWLAATGFYRRKTASFGLELDGRLVVRGHSCAIDTWFVTETMVGSVVGVVLNVIEIDVDCPVAAGDHVVLRDRTGLEWGPIPIIQGASLRHLVLDPAAVAAEAADTGLSLSMVAGIDDGDGCAARIGPLARLGEQWLVKEIDYQDGNKSNITAIIDNPAVYEAIGATIPPESPLNWPLIPTEAPLILRVSAKVVQHTSSLELQWSLMASPGASRFEVQVSQDGGDWQGVYLGESPTGTAPVRYSDAPVEMRARAYGASGVGGEWSAPYALVVPKPLVTATGAEPGVITWESQAKELRNALKQLTYKVDAQNVVNDRVAAIVSILDRRDWLQDSKRTDELKVAQDNLSAAITEVRQVSIAGDQALAQLITDLDATVGDNTSDIEQLALTMVTAEQAAALVQDSISAVFGGGSANAKMRLVASAGVGGVLASWDIEMSATGANGSFAKTGLRALVWSDAGVMKSKIQFAADRCEFLKNDGSSFAIFDAVNGKILANAILATSLAAISANLGTITAGKLQSADGLLVLDLDAKALIIYSSPGVEVLRLGYHP